eukprot:Tbor_TRINITY_DN4404_c0_g1::TRINITY_DN4404_c0_g1_i1::g.8053::m.8053
MKMSRFRLASIVSGSAPLALSSRGRYTSALSSYKYSGTTLTWSSLDGSLGAVPPSLTTVYTVRFRGKDSGQRLTFEERAERRTRKTSEARGNEEACMLEAQEYANNEFNEHLEGEFQRLFNNANLIVLKVTNLHQCMEGLDIDVAGKKIPLIQAAQIVKKSDTELQIVPKQSSFASPILQRLMRFDSTISASKDQGFIKIIIQPTTTARREKAAQDIEGVKREFMSKLKEIRLHSVKILGQIGAGANFSAQLIAEMDLKVKEFQQEKIQEFDDLKVTVMSAGEDEAD